MSKHIVKLSAEDLQALVDALTGFTYLQTLEQEDGSILLKSYREEGLPIIVVMKEN